MTRSQKHLFAAATVVAVTVVVRSAALTEGLPVGSTMPSQAGGAAQVQPSDAPTFVHNGREIPNTVQEILNPKHTVLLVHEMLNDWISPGGALDKRGRRIDASGIMPPIAKLLAAARSKNVRVAYVRWTTHADGSTSSDPEIRRAWNRLSNPDDRRFLPTTVQGTWGWEIPDEIKPISGDWVINKYRPDAFFATPLEAMLRWNGIRTIVLVGIGSEVGGIPTILTASNKGYFTVAVEDCLRPSDPARAADAMTYIHGPATVMNHTDLLDVWAKSPRFDVTPPAPATPGQPPVTITYQGRKIPNTEEEILNPKHTALVVHEMLNDFISDGGKRPGGKIDATKIMKPIAELLAAARKKSVRVAYVRWSRHADGSTNSEPEIRNAQGRRANAPYTIQGTWGWEAPDEIKPVAGEWVIPKWRTDAFFSTPLDTLLRWNGIKTMVIVGIGAEAGIVPTLMHAQNLGYFTVAVSDGIGPSNPARMDDAMRFINNLAMVKTHNEVIDLWNTR